LISGGEGSTLTTATAGNTAACAAIGGKNTVCWGAVLPLCARARGARANTRRLRSCILPFYGRQIFEVVAYIMPQPDPQRCKRHGPLTFEDRHIMLWRSFTPTTSRQSRTGSTRSSLTLEYLSCTEFGSDSWSTVLR
jgi:hypothetical protein